MKRYPILVICFLLLSSSLSLSARETLAPLALNYPTDSSFTGDTIDTIDELRDYNESKETDTKGGIEIKISFGDTDDTGDISETGLTGESDIYMSSLNTEERKARLRDVSTRWLMLDLGLSSYHFDGSFETPDALGDWELNTLKSYEVNLHLVQQRVNLIAHHVNLAYGLSLFWNRYSFQEPVTLLANTDQVQLTQLGVDDPFFSEEYTKNRLGTTTLAFPVMLNLESRPHKKGQSFHLNVGGYAGLIIESNLKQNSEELGKRKIEDDFNLNKWQYGLMAQFGYGALNFYGKMSANELFKDGRGGPVLYPFSFGVSIVYY